MKKIYSLIPLMGDLMRYRFLNEVNHLKDDRYWQHMIAMDLPCPVKPWESLRMFARTRRGDVLTFDDFLTVRDLNGGPVLERQRTDRCLENLPFSSIFSWFTMVYLYNMVIFSDFPGLMLPRGYLVQAKHENPNQGTGLTERFCSETSVGSEPRTGNIGA